MSKELLIHILLSFSREHELGDTLLQLNLGHLPKALASQLLLLLFFRFIFCFLCATVRVFYYGMPSIRKRALLCYDLERRG